jgi:hypothetical protein
MARTTQQQLCGSSTKVFNLEKKRSSFIRSCFGDMIYDRYEKAKIK